MGAILTVTLNPSIDVSTRVERLVPAKKLRCSQERRDAGGGGINVARVMHRLGGDVLAAYVCGGLAGQMLDRLLLAEGLRCLVLPTRGDTRENVTVFETASGQEYRFVLPGPHLSDGEWRQIMKRLRAQIAPFEWLVLSGSSPPGAPPDAYAQLARIGAESGARVVVDASGAALKAAMAERPFLIKPNLDELRELTGDELEDMASRAQAARRLIDDGVANTVALTMGAEGALIATKDGAWQAPAVEIDAVSSIGAGDSFVAATIWALDSGRHVEEALRYGVAAGSAALLTPGTALCRKTDVEQALSRVEVKPL